MAKYFTIDVFITIYTSCTGCVVNVGFTLVFKPATSCCSVGYVKQVTHHVQLLIICLENTGIVWFYTNIYADFQNYWNLTII